MAKAKVSVSIPLALVQEIDRGVRANRYASRSAAIETALTGWAKRERALARDAAIEAYYSGQDSDEKADDRAWSEFAYDGFVDSARRELTGTPRRPPAPRRRGK